MEKIDFSLSYKNYLELPLDKYHKDFVIYVNEKSYQTNRMIADLLSPNLRKMHYSDESITEISIYTKSKELEEIDYFQDFLNFPIFHNYKIDLQHRIHYAEYFYLLGNYDEAINIQKENFRNITIENAVERLLFILNTMDKIPYEYFEEKNPLNLIITFISSHFDDIDSNELKKLPIEIIQSIISNNSLRISHEYLLFSFIRDLYNENHENAFLFEYVLFQNIGEDAFRDFLREFDTDYLTRQLWRKIQLLFFKSKKNNDKIFRYKKNDSSNSDSDFTFGEVLNNLNFREKSFYGQPNYDNNIDNNSLVPAFINENDDSDNNNFSPEFNNDSDDNDIILL